MAVAYQTIGSVTWSTSGTATIPKPASLAVGDLMIAIVAQQGDGTNQAAPDGSWTLIRRTELNTVEMSSWWKVAVSGDVSATDFAFTGNGTIIGSILRIDGQHGSSPVNASNHGTAQNTATPSFATGITPTIADSLIIMTGIAEDATAKTSSTYAITTSDPSWTERVDDDLDGVLKGGFFIATASRPEITSTGAWSFAYGDAAGDICSQIIAIVPPLNVTVTPAVIQNSATPQDPAIAGGGTVSPAVITSTSSVQTPDYANQAKWSAQAKSSAPTWSNTSKT